MPALLATRNITKRFPGVVANDRLNLDIAHGEIHALLGENGAGKTTLMNMLYGLYQPTEGSIWWEGGKIRIHSALDAINLGIGMIHQHFMLVPIFTVTENVIMGRKVKDGLVIDTRVESGKIRALSEKYGLDIDPDAYIHQLSVGMQQRVEILKALYRDAKLLLLDEPTSVLTPQETRELFKTLRSLAKQGTTVILITHKLDEVMSISDRVTVLRRGRMIGTVNTSETSKPELAKMMVGREVVLQVERPEAAPGKPKLVVENLAVMNDKGLIAIDKMNFEIREGEILGVAGVDGNGQKELSEALTGMRAPISGRILLNGVSLAGAKPSDCVRAGMSFVPQNRNTTGSIGELSIEENSILRSHRSRPFCVRGLFRKRAIADYAKRMIKKYDIRVPSEKAAVQTLSGGNMQKLIVGREITRPHTVLIAVQPTMGLDVAAIEAVYGYLLEERRKGTAILLISTELNEIFTLSDRIAVIFDGRFVAKMAAGEADIDTLGLLMAGSSPEARNAKQ